MADVIQWADWGQLQQMISEGSSAVAGMTAAEAEAAMNATVNSGMYVYNSTVAAGASNVIDFPTAATAAQAFEEFTESGGATTAAGAAAAATGAAKTTGNLAIIKNAISSVGSSVAGVLSVSLPAAAAALAPIAGVALGAGLYNANPTLWEKISRTLLPFCYDDSASLPVLVDINGNTYFDNNVINAFKQLMADEGIGGESQQHTPPGFPYNFSVSVISPPSCPAPPAYGDGAILVFGPNVNGVTRYAQGGSLSEVGVYSTTPGAAFCSMYRTDDVIPSLNLHVNASYTYDGKTVYFYNSAIGGTTLPADPNTENVQWGYICWVAAYGVPSGGSFPEGTSQWQGNSYPETPDPIQVLNGYDQQDDPIFTPYFPVAMPIGDPVTNPDPSVNPAPGTTTDPTVNPNPATNPYPAPAIDPWVSPQVIPEQYPQPWPYAYPEPAPLPDPTPAPQPVPSPTADPTKDYEREPSPEPSPDPDPSAPTTPPSNPRQPDTPTDKGNIPQPVIPISPGITTGAASLLHVYNPTQAQLDAFGSWLWSTWSDPNIWSTIQKLFNDPMDGIIGLHELYATPATGGSSTIRCGYLDSQVPSALVGSRYTTINCGSVVVEEYYQNYLDYSPYTQCFIYLPFIGIVHVSADDIIGNAVNITYHVDSYTGCCIAVISVARNNYTAPVYQFEGNCAVEIPITSGYPSALMSGLLALAGTAISGSPSVGLTAAHMGRAGLGKNTVQHSGSFGSSYGAMGAKQPYIIVRRPVQKIVTNYSVSYGYPAHKMVFVGNCNGFLRAKEVRVTSTTATNIEKDMIVNALKQGVYVR